MKKKKDERIFPPPAVSKIHLKGEKRKEQPQIQNGHLTERRGVEMANARSTAKRCKTQGEG